VVRRGCRWPKRLATKAQDSAQAARDSPTVRFDPSAVDDREGTASRAGNLPPDTPLFTVPAGLGRILDRDLVAAGLARRVEVEPGKWIIDKRDERGRTIDVHALRHTFGTMLSKSGAFPRTAQAAMRHSTVNLTMNTYTDPKLLDVAGAIESLPTLPLEGGRQTEAGALSATGTDDSTASQFAPEFAPATGKTGLTGALPVDLADKGEPRSKTAPVAASACHVNRKDPLTTPVRGSSEWAMTGSNRRHPRCKRGALAD